MGNIKFFLDYPNNLVVQRKMDIYYLAASG